jgi:hypothetical protein
MNNPSKTNPATGGASDNQRDALEDSEKEAASDQPGSFKDKATAEKIVEVGPDMTESPIRGLDPDRNDVKR